MNISIRHLRIFILVAECGSMSLAAKELFISQPSISQAIKEIEECYGLKLFERLSKKLYITESGELLLNYARHIIKSFEEMEVNIKNTSEKISLNIGATVTVGTCMVDRIIKNYRNSKGNAEVNVVVNNTNIIEQLLLQSKLDLAIVEGRITNEDLIKVPIYKDNLAIVVGKEHDFYNRKSIRIEELKGQSLISREEGSGSRELFKEVLLSNGITMNRRWSCTTTEAIKSATVAGEGLAVLSTLIVAEEVRDERLRIIPIDNFEITRDICVVYHKDKFMSENLKSFIKCAEEYN